MSVIVSDAENYAAHTLNPDGSVKSELSAAYATDGSVAWTSRDAQTGQNVVTSVNAAGQIVRKVTQTPDAKTGASTEETLDFNDDGSLKDRTLATTRADGRVVDISRDRDGDGVVDQSEHIVTREDGVVTRDTTTTTVEHGVMVETATDSNGDGVVDRVLNVLMEVGVAAAVLADTQFGRSAQTVSSWTAISGGTAPLR